MLSRSRIVEAALHVINTEGLASVSMRSVARRLNVDAKSLYNHVDGKDGLLDAVTEYILSSFEVPRPTGVVEEDLRNVARAFRSHALHHPQATLLVLARPTTSIGSLAPLETILAILVKAGASPEQAVHLLRLFMACMVGSVLRDASMAPTFGDTISRALARGGTVLERSGFTHILAAGRYLRGYDGEAEFEFSLQAAIAAIASQLSQKERP